MINNFLTVDIKELSKCKKKECEYNILCVKNFNSTYNSVIMIIFLINNMTKLFWNINKVNSLFPKEIEKLIYIYFLNLMKQNLPKNRKKVGHCYFKNYCHEIFEAYYSFDILINLETPKLIKVSGNYCYKCGRVYCEKCQNSIDMLYKCNMCK